MEARMKVRIRLISKTTHSWSMVYLMALKMMKKVSLRLNNSRTSTKESNRGLKMLKNASIITNR